MLSSVLNSRRAIEVNIAIMRTFVALRRILSDNEKIRKKIESLERKYDEQFRQVFAVLAEMLKTDEKPAKQIGYHTETQTAAVGKRQGRRSKIRC
jgi:hypothetical protein